MTKKNKFYFSPPMNGVGLKMLVLGVLMTIITWVLLLTPDMLFESITGTKTYDILAKKPWPLLGFALLLSLAGSPRLRSVLLVVVGCLMALWLGTYAYFGNVLRPAQIYQATDQWFEVQDAMFGAEAKLIWPVLLAVFVSIAAAWFVQNRLFNAHVFRLNKLGNILLAIAFIGALSRPFIFPVVSVVFPSPTMTAFTGPINALGVSLRLKMTNSTTDVPDELQQKVVATRDLGDEKTTVAIVMGESINPEFMQVFDPARKTGSALMELSKKDGPFKLIPRIGFAAGVSTLGSAPGFFRGDYFPATGTTESINLASVAKDNGFDVALFSVQRIKSLLLANMPEAASFIHTSKSATSAQRKRRDDVLVDLLKSTPMKGDRHFYALHQRVNHAPYTDHCDHVDGYKERPDLEPGREEAFKVGMVCYDRNLALLFEEFAKKPGAVYVFATADHNELMGFNGLWAHGHATLETSLVPMILYTNRPESAVAKAFESSTRMSSYDFSKLVAAAAGVEIGVEAFDPNVFYVNHSAPYGEGGYMKVTRKGDENYVVENKLPDGTVYKTTDVKLNLPSN